MGIYVDYELWAECDEETLVARLEAVRRRCMDLPLASVGEVERIEPVYSPMTFRLLRDAGHAIPEAVAERLRPVEDDKEHSLRCIELSPMLQPKLPKRQAYRYVAPALRLLDETDLWRSEDLPEELSQWALGMQTFWMNRKAIEFDFASVLLRYGYLLFLDPGEGSETVQLGLSTFRRPAKHRYRKPPAWWGKSFTKTQYAKRFIQVHETVCRVIDIVREEGLLLKGSDNCGYYASRSWENAADRVNEELIFAQAMSGMIDLAFGNMREEGVSVQVIEDNAAKATPVDFSEALERERRRKAE